MARPVNLVTYQDYIGFLALGRALGVEAWDVAALVEAGAIPFRQSYKGRSGGGVRLIRREDANKYLRKMGKKPVPLVGED